MTVKVMGTGELRLAGPYLFGPLHFLDNSLYDERQWRRR